MLGIGEYFNELAKLDEAEGDRVSPESEELGEEVEGSRGQMMDEEDQVVMMQCPKCGYMGTLDEEEGCPVCGCENLDEKTVSVVRDGRVQKKKISTRKHRLTSAQKAALAKARKKAHSGAAEKSRAKSNRVRSKRGLNESDTIVCRCPECGYEGEMEEVEEGDD